MKKINLFLTAILFAGFVNAQTVADFEDLALPADSSWNGSDLSGGFADGHAFFVNSYDAQYKFWSGFGYSNKTDVTTVGVSNDMSAIPGHGYNGSATYAVGNCYGDAIIRLTNGAAGKPLTGVYVTNGTYPYLSMKDGDQFAKKFGGASGNDPDWFLLKIKGFSGGVLTTDSVEFYLADYRSNSNADDYIVNDWRWVDLSGLGNVDSVQFFLSSSDVGAYGMNTPAYFCIDAFATNDVPNTLPLTKDDNFSITYLQDTLLNVLGNDFDTASAQLTVSLVAASVIPGAVANVQYNAIMYNPAIGIVAVDTLIYRVCDQNNNCDTAKVYLNVTSLTAINEVVADDVQVVPNPFTNTFAIYHQPGVEQVKLYNLQGRELRSIITNNGASKTDIDGQQLPAGMYFVRLIAGSNTTIKQVVKQ